METEVTAFIRLCTELRALGATSVSHGYFSATFAGTPPTPPKPVTTALGAFSTTTAPVPANHDEVARVRLLEAIADD